jgi:hypothetical protein
MCTKRVCILIVLIASICAPIASARSAQRLAGTHGRHVLQPAVNVGFAGGRLVEHPANNIACNTRDRPSRAIPCDQPVWIYGSPCEIDEGEGFYRDCDQPPGVGIHDRWRQGRP